MSHISNGTKYHYNNVFFNDPLPCIGYLLLQAGEMYCNADTVLQAHDQRCFELTAVVDGKGRILSGESGADVAKNDCFVSLKGDRHQILSDSHEPLRFRFIALEAAPDTDEGELLDHIGHYLSPEHRAVCVPTLNERMLRIFEELENKLVYANEAIGNELSGILIDLIRAFEQKTKRRYPVRIRDDAALAFHVVKYIDRSLLTMKNLYELEAEFNYSYNYISAVFSRIMKTPINEYYQRAKMGTARELLEGGHSVTEVAELLQYSSIHTFSRAFKNYFGLSPHACKTQENI